MLVNAAPCALHDAFANHAGDAVAGLVYGMRAPFVEYRVPLERPGQPFVEMLDERLRCIANTAKRARGDFTDRDGVRPAVAAHRLDGDADTEQEMDPVVLNPSLDENAGDLPAADEDIVRPLHTGVDGEDLPQVGRPDVRHG